MEQTPRQDAPRCETPPPESARKPYAAPRLTAHGKLTAVTADQVSSQVTSDRNAKEAFAPVDPHAILARVVTLPIETWSYKGEHARHLGPMAQDFAAAFGLGADDRHIFPLDAGGVALAALQGLHALVQTQTARLQALEREVAALRAEEKQHARARQSYRPPGLTAYGRVPALTLAPGSLTQDGDPG
jgi:hypothetical protein